MTLPKRGIDDSTFLFSRTKRKCYEHLNVKLEVGTKLSLKYCSLERVFSDCPIAVSLHEMFLYDTPLKLILHQAQSVFLVIIYKRPHKRIVPKVPRVVFQ